MCIRDSHCASSVEIEDVSHEASCHKHVPNSYGTEFVSYEKVYDFPLNSAPAFALSKTYGVLFASSIESRMSRIKHLAAYMFQTLTVRNVRPTRKSKISRLTRLRLLHFPKTYGMLFASSVEIEDVSHKTPCHLHVPNSYGTECPSYEKV